MQASVRTLSAVAAASVVVTGCITTNSTVKGGIAADSAQVREYQIGAFSDKLFKPRAYAVLEQDASQWRLVRLSASRPARTAFTQEVVAIDVTGTRLAPGFVRPAGDQFDAKGNLTWYDCSEVLAAIAGNDDKPADYNGCGKTSFTKIDFIGSAGKTAVSGVLTLGLAAGTKRKVDVDAMDAALRQTGAYAVLGEYAQLLQLVDEQRAVVEKAKAQAGEVVKPVVKVTDAGKFIPAGVRVVPKLTETSEASFDVADALDVQGPGDKPLGRIAELKRIVLERAQTAQKSVKVKVSCENAGDGFAYACLPANTVVALGDPNPVFDVRVTDNKVYLERQEQLRWTRQAAAAADQARAASEAAKPRDSMGREVIRGPVGAGYYDNVHIISNGVGVDSRYGRATITNSVIEAAVCVVVGPSGIYASGNQMICSSACVREEGPVFDAQFINNSCSN